MEPAWAPGSAYGGQEESWLMERTHPHSGLNLTHSILRGPPTHLIIKQSQLILSGQPCPMLTGLFCRVCLCVCVCKRVACVKASQSPRSRGGRLSESYATCSDTSYWSLIPSPMVQDRLTDRPLLLYTHLCLKCSPVIHCLFLFILSLTLHTQWLET